MDGPVTSESLVSREFSRIFLRFHLSISISKHFNFTFTSRKEWNKNLLHFSFLENSERIFFFTFHFSKKVKAFLISLSFSRKKSEIVHVNINFVTQKSRFGVMFNTKMIYLECMMILSLRTNVVNLMRINCSTVKRSKSLLRTIPTVLEMKKVALDSFLESHKPTNMALNSSHTNEWLWVGASFCQAAKWRQPSSSSVPPPAIHHHRPE